MTAIYNYEGPLGRYVLEEKEETLTRIWLGDRISLVPQHIEIRETPLLKETHRQLMAYFDRKLKQFNVPMALEGTPFQLKIWELLQGIPYGTTITYGELARRNGDVKACRAVGMANSRNPLPILIPCHRVVGSGGKLTGYTGGLDIKVALLQIEGVGIG